MFVVADCDLITLSDLRKYFSPPEGTESPDLFCMMTQCGRETLACLSDRDCLKTLACLVPCGDDQTCTFHCTVNYENQLFHEMTACNINKAGCITLKGEGRPGAGVVKNPSDLTCQSRRWRQAVI